MTKKNIVQVVAPLHFVSKLLGYSLFSIDRWSYAVSFKLIDAVLLTWTVLVNFVLFHYFWIANSFEIVTISKSDIIGKSLPIVTFCSSVIYVITILMLFAKKNYSRAILETIGIIDEMVR
jgi:hypothetical protein